MKKLVLAFCILFPIWLMAQDMPFTVKNETRYGASCMVGKTEVDSIDYYQVRFIPEFKVWKLSIGLDLDFLVDKDKKLKKDDWDKLSVIPNKFYYIRYGQSGDPWFVHLGGFPNHTMSNGLIMLNYSNMLLYPEYRNTGLLVESNPNIQTKPTFEVFTSNIEKDEIMSFAAHCQPLPDSTVKILDKTVLGFQVIFDRNQYSNLKYEASDSLYQVYKNKKEGIAMYSFDYALPVLEKGKVTFGHYAEFAHIAGYGTGIIFPGIYSQSKTLKVNLEFRTYGAEFLPAFFDHKYEEQRAIQYDDFIITKEDMLKGIKRSYGWYGKIQTNIKGKIKAMVAWQDMYGKDLKTGKSFWLRFWADTQYKRLEEVSFSYSKINVEQMDLGKIVAPSSSIAAKLTFRVSKKKWYLGGTYSESYQDKNHSGEINYMKETKRSVAVGVKYQF